MIADYFVRGSYWGETAVLIVYGDLHNLARYDKIVAVGGMCNKRRME
jgi:hypothetical protein